MMTSRLSVESTIFFVDRLESFICFVLRLHLCRSFLRRVCGWWGGVCLRLWRLRGLSHWFRRCGYCWSDLAYLQVYLEHFFMEALEEVFFGRFEFVEVDCPLVGVYFSVYPLKICLVSL